MAKCHRGRRLHASFSLDPGPRASERLIRQSWGKNRQRRDFDFSAKPIIAPRVGGSFSDICIINAAPCVQMRGRKTEYSARARLLSFSLSFFGTCVVGVCVCIGMLVSIWILCFYFETRIREGTQFSRIFAKYKI